MCVAVVIAVVDIGAAAAAVARVIAAAAARSINALARCRRLALSTACSFPSTKRALQRKVQINNKQACHYCANKQKKETATK